MPWITEWYSVKQNILLYVILSTALVKLKIDYKYPLQIEYSLVVTIKFLTETVHYPRIENTFLQQGKSWSVFVYRWRFEQLTAILLLLTGCQNVPKLSTPEAEFLDVIWTKVLELFLLAIHSHLYLWTLLPPPPSKSGLKLVCNVNIVYKNLKSENSQDYALKPQRNCTFMNLASGKAGAFTPCLSLASLCKMCV